MVEFHKTSQSLNVAFESFLPVPLLIFEIPEIFWALFQKNEIDFLEEVSCREVKHFKYWKGILMGWLYFALRRIAPYKNKLVRLEFFSLWTIVKASFALYTTFWHDLA